MAYDKNISQEENIVRVFETGANLIGKGTGRSIISAAIGTSLGFGLFAYSSNLMVNATEPYRIAIATGIAVLSSMMAIINADIISQNLYARKNFNKDFKSMDLKDKISYIGEYIPYSHKMRYTEWFDSIVSLICFGLMLVLLALDTINEYSNTNLILTIIYLFAFCTNIMTFVYNTKVLSIYTYTHNAWKSYCKYK